MTTPRPDRWCCLVVELAAAALPAAQRQRYALEFIAELYGMPRRHQFRHSIQVLASAWRLRAALAEPALTPVQGDVMMITAKRPLRCHLRLHRWQTARAEDGGRYESCSRCGHDRTENHGSPWLGAAGL